MCLEWRVPYSQTLSVATSPNTIAKRQDRFRTSEDALIMRFCNHYANSSLSKISEKMTPKTTQVFVKRKKKHKSVAQIQFCKSQSRTTSWTKWVQIAGSQLQLQLKIILDPTTYFIMF